MADNYEDYSREQLLRLLRERDRRRGQRVARRVVGGYPLRRQ